jgi:DNA repair exonuclease SbcCD ATPase subunit
MVSKSEVQKIIDEMGLDLELEDELFEVDIVDGSESRAVDFGTVRVDVVKPVVAKRGGVQDLSVVEERDGVQYKVNVSTRPECPTCGNVPSDEDESARLKSRCGICDRLMCSQCMLQTDCCGKLVCRYDSESYSDTGLVLCPKHREDKLREVEFDREMTRWVELKRKELEILEKRLEFRKAEFDHEEQERRLEQEEKVDRWNVALEKGRVENERRKTQVRALESHLSEERKQMAEELQHEIDRRKQRIEAFKAWAEADLERFEAEVDAEIRRGELELEEFEAVSDHFMDVREHELEEKKHELDAQKALVDRVLEAQEQEHDMEMDRLEEGRKQRELLMSVQEKLREQKWDELNDFLDFKGRLQNEDFERVGSSSTGDSEVILKEVDGDESDRPVYEFEAGGGDSN